MAARLITDFVKIAQSGPCIDGRSIAAAWLNDMAETYDPTTYTAYIWPDHIRWGNNYGAVAALQCRDEDGLTSLYAQLAPNAQYVWENQFDQKLHFSIEVAENFAGTGKAYLAGLGITDSPASLGTDALKFSSRCSCQNTQFFSNAPAMNLRAEAEETAPGWFKKFIGSFTPHTPPTPNPTNPINEVHSMTPEQFATFSTRLDGMEAGLKDIKDLFSSQSAGKDATPTASTAAHQAQAEPQSQTSTEFSAAVAPLLEGITKLSAQVGDMAKRFEAALPGTSTHPSTGPAPDQGGSPLL